MLYYVLTQPDNKPLMEPTETSKEAFSQVALSYRDETGHAACVMEVRDPKHVCVFMALPNYLLGPKPEKKRALK